MEIRSGMKCIWSAPTGVQILGIAELKDGVLAVATSEGVYLIDGYECRETADLTASELMAIDRERLEIAIRDIIREAQCNGINGGPMITEGALLRRAMSAIDQFADAITPPLDG